MSDNSAQTIAQKKNQRHRNGFGCLRTLLEFIVIIAVVFLVLLLLFQAIVSVLDMFDLIEVGDETIVTGKYVSPDDTLHKAEAAAASAENTANNIETLLSFLEGTAVLVGLALGAAAYIGFRELGDLRERSNAIIDSFRQQTEGEIGTWLTTQEKVIQDQIGGLMRYATPLEELPIRLEESKQLQQNYSDLLIASQELRLSNHLEAYEAAMRVLARDANNTPALYIAGWLELQYISGKRQDGVKKLRRTAEIQPDWPTARAAYGVGLRRQARDTTDAIEKRRLFLEAEAQLLSALKQSPHLLDLSLESFWGPVAGIRREMGDIPHAIEAYQAALKVTPTSSYPQGNLAALLLSQAKTPGERDQALDEFEKTLQYATIELAVNPGDYYHVMDIAMSRIMLGQKDAENFDTGFIFLDSALNMHVTPEMLNTSLRAGWEFLDLNCPDDWAEVKQNLKIALERIKKAIEERQPKS